MDNGGQGGFAICPRKQSANSSNCGNSAVVKIEEIPAQSNQISLAALWLHHHREALTHPVIPTLRERFGLTIIEAIEASKKAHSLAYPGA